MRPVTYFNSATQCHLGKKADIRKQGPHASISFLAVKMQK
jgi:hypothetical protein